MSEQLTYATFADHLGSSFQVQGEFEHPITFNLIEVERLPQSQQHSGQRQDPFSLLFKGPLETYCAQQIFHLEHATLGQVSIFLVPVGQDEDGFRYEAIFN